MDIFLGSLCVVFGFVLCWFTKDNIIVMVKGSEGFVTSLETKAKALKAKLP